MAKFVIETEEAYTSWQNNPPLLLNTRINSMKDLKVVINDIKYMIDEAQVKIRREIDDLNAFSEAHEYLNEDVFLKDMINRFTASPDMICGINRLPIINDERHYILLEYSDKEYAIYGIPVIIAGFDKKKEAEKFIKIITKFKEDICDPFVVGEEKAEKWEETLEDIPEEKEKYLIRTAQEIKDCETLRELRQKEKYEIPGFDDLVFPTF